MTFTPADDAYIANGSPTSNYGSATTLQVDNSPVKHFLLKFDVTGVGSQTITDAKIRLYNVNAASAGGNFYHVADDTWQEETVTWNNAPAADTTLLASLGSVSPNTWYEVDVTSLVTGDGTYSLRISDSVGGADYSSKEGANPPELVVTLGGTPVATNTPTLTPTPGPSPTPTDTPIATATFTPTPTPILPVFSNAAFTYDGDAKRVKSVITTNIATTTTYFVGMHYEVADGVITKSYYAGSQRIAMRTNGTLNFLLGDHLGSTSLTTDANGTVISELRYGAWGEPRYSSGNTPTKYQYTGQYSYTGEFGLHYYNARWYDSSLGRFTQADTIVPGMGNPDAWDRYSYVTNNPLRYTDPTGHMWDVGDEGGSGGPTIPLPIPDNDNGGGSGGGGDYCSVLPWLCGGSGGPSSGDGVETPNDDFGLSDNGSEFEVNCNDPTWGCVTDVGGTWQDPAVYISIAVGGWASGLFNEIGWGMLYGCLRISICARTVAGTTGITVYRVWGGTSGPGGRSWTPVNPTTVPNYAAQAGLPPGNIQQYLSIGTIYSMEGVQITSASSIPPNPGGLLEYFISNPQLQVTVQEIQYLIR